MIKKILVAVLVIISLAACSGPVSKNQMNAAEDLCATNGGVQAVNVEFFSDWTTVNCKNGAKFEKTIAYNPK